MLTLKRAFRLLGWLTLSLVGLIIVSAVAFPTGRYVARAAWEESRILLRRKPIELIVADSLSPADVRERLRLVLDAREFAVSNLDLEAGRSFTTYSRVDSDTLVLVLSVAYRDRLEPYRWWFPIVGRVPYKGYFDFAEAERVRADFERRGFDTYMRPASAFSTLGWFNDPLLSTTLAQRPHDLANTVIHELSHNTLFVRDEVEFNESFASFVGSRGAAAFFRSRGDTATADLVDLSWEDDKRLGRFWASLRQRLETAYAALPDDSTARVRARDEIYAQARRELVDSVGPQLRTIPRQYLERLALDNAALLARRTYSADLDLFDAVWERCGRDVRAAVAQIVTLAKDADEPFAALRGWVAEQGVGTEH